MPILPQANIESTWYLIPMAWCRSLMWLKLSSGFWVHLGALFTASAYLHFRTAHQVIWKTTGVKLFKLYYLTEFRGTHMFDFILCNEYPKTEIIHIYFNFPTTFIRIASITKFLLIGNNNSSYLKFCFNWIPNFSWNLWYKKTWKCLNF